ncbi:MAG: hypothetical protein GF313_04635 [Caldithrix sp.]|nr:hypothetical protein [Caldithrix sp.]
MVATAILIPITSILAIALVIYYFIRVKHEEKMKILEKDFNGEELKEVLIRRPRSIGEPLRMVKWGMILIGIGLAILIGNQFDYEHQEAMTIGFLFLFPGVALILFYVFYNRLSNQQHEDEQTMLSEKQNSVSDS